MSIRVVDRVLKASRTQSPTQQLVLIVIADFCANDDGTSAYPSVATIARRTRLTKRGVRNALKGLQASGDLRIEPGGGRSTNRYTVLLAPNETPALKHVQPCTTFTPERISALAGTSDSSGGTVVQITPESPAPNPLKNRIPNRHVTGASRRRARPETVRKPEAVVQLDRFERIWAAYPRKKNRKAAEIEWLRIAPAPDEAMTDHIAARIRRYAETEWKDRESRFIPHLRTFLHNARWEDEIESAGATTEGPAGPDPLAVMDAWERERVATHG